MKFKNGQEYRVIEVKIVAYLWPGGMDWKRHKTACGILEISLYCYQVVRWVCYLLIEL